MSAGIVRLCRTCGHSEAHHGPISGRRVDDGAVLPGRLCYFSENMGWRPNLCFCPGFNSEPNSKSCMEIIRMKLTGKEGSHDVEGIQETAGK